MVTAIFPAAGQGRRMKAEVNKIFLELAENPILSYTVVAFSKCEVIDDLIIVAAPDEVDFVKKLLSEVQGLKPWQVVAGGSERQYSIANALAVLPKETEIVLVHDAARPLIDMRVIEDVVEQTRIHGATIAAVPAKSTIKVVNASGVVTATPDRNTLWTVQTPQGFRADILLKAYEKAARDGFLGTDDASLVERMGIEVNVVRGEYKNLKITTPDDLIMAEAFLKRRNKS